MPLIEWDSSFSVNVELIDEQHNMLVKMINDLYDAMLSGKENEELSKLINQMSVYAAMHFAREEHYFDTLGYPDAEEHKDEHLYFENQVSQFENEFNEGKQELTNEILQFLSNWLVKHIKGTDKKFGPFLNERGIS